MTAAINAVLLDDLIKFPVTIEEQAIEKQKQVLRELFIALHILFVPLLINCLFNRFMQLGGFPGTISAIDGTHVAIFAPPKNDLEYLERAYVNRKNFHSINVEIVSTYLPQKSFMISVARFNLNVHYNSSLGLQR